MVYFFKKETEWTNLRPSSNVSVADVYKRQAQEFITEIKVEMFNHQGALANLTAAINTTTSNIQSLNTEEKDGRVYSAFIRLTARDRVHLANIMRKIRVMPDVIKVTRNRN